MVAAGKLSLVSSGPREAYDEVEPILELLGRHVTYVGEGEKARLVKICHNIMLGVVAQNMAEIVVLAEKGGVPRAAMLDFLNNSVMGSMFTQYKSPAYVNLDFTPTFTPVLLRKDLDLGPARRRRARRPDAGHRPPPARPSRPRVAQGRTTEDFAVLLELQARNSGLELVSRGRRGRRRARPARGGLSTCVAPLPAPGHMGVDYEQRVDFARLRDYRLGRAKESLEASECGAFLLFDFYNIRYTTQTWIGGALGDKMIRYALLARGKDPVLWDFGSAVKHHQQYSQWVPTENYRAGFLGFRGAVAPTVGLMADAVAEIKSLLVEAGVADLPVGVDIVEPAVPVRDAAAGPDGRRLPAAHARRPGDQVARRDHAAQPGGGHGRRRLPGHRRDAEARHPRERDRRARQQAALRDGLRPGRGGQRDLR